MAGALVRPNQTNVAVTFAGQPASGGGTAVPTNQLPEPSQKFIPKEGYELIGQLVKVDESSGRKMTRFLIAMDVVPDDSEPSGYKYIKLTHVEPFVNMDGFEKLSDLLLLASNPPMSYLHEGARPELIAGEISVNMIKTIGTNFSRWGITNPSLIPMFSSVCWEFITSAWSQQTELLRSLIPNAFPRHSNAEDESKRPTTGRMG